MTVLALLSTQVIDTTTVGRSVMTAATAAAARTAIGAGVGDVLTTGSYSNPSWITGLAWSKISTTPTTLSGYGITDAITSAAVAAGYQPLDADLTALAGLTGTNNIYYRSAADTWSSVTIGTGLTFTGGTLAASAGIGGSTGSTANLILRASGTGGATLQNSPILVPDNATASPNNTVNHASIQATGGTTNVSVSLVPKGTGSFSLVVPDATTAGGNARGANAVDLRTTARAAAANVASGTQSFLGPNGVIASNTGSVSFGGSATGQNAVSFGSLTTASGAASLAGGGNSTASNNNCFSWGYFAVASGDTAVAFNWGTASGILSFGHGEEFTSYLPGMYAHGGGGFGAVIGTNQFGRLILRAVTTNNTATNMLISLNYASRAIIPAGKVWHWFARICGVKSDGSAIAEYMRQGVLKRVGNVTTLVTSQTIGTDYEDNAATDVAITADDTNEALNIAVTGITGETWRWQAIVEFGDFAYGT